MFNHEYEQMMMGKIDGFGLCGRTLQRMRTVGANYLHDRKTMDLARTDLDCPRTARVDEPFLIEFENGDILSVFLEWQKLNVYLAWGINVQNWATKAVINAPNEDADVLFAPCAGQKYGLQKLAGVRGM